MNNDGSVWRRFPGFRKSAAELTWTLLARGSGAPLALLANIGLARVLGASQFGRYTTLLSAGLVAGGVAIYGTAPVFTREIAAPKAGGRREAFLYVTRWASAVVLPFMTIAAGLVLTWLLLGVGAPPSEWEGDVAVILLIPLSGLGYLLNAILSGLGRVAQGQLLGNGWRNAWLLLGVGGMLLAGRHEAADALWVQVASYLLLAALGVWLIRRALGVAPEGGVVQDHQRRCDRSQHREWWRSATAFFGFSLGMMLFVRLDVIVVNALAGDTQAGYFGAAARLVQVVQLPGLVWLSWLQPRLAHESAQGQWRKARRTYMAGLLGVAGTTGALVLCVWPLAPWLMALFGDGFNNAVAPFRWLAAGYLAWAIAVPSLALLTMSGGEKFVAWATCGELALALVGGVLFIGQFGARGGAWAWSTALIVANGLIFVRGLWVILRKPHGDRWSRHQ